MATEDRLVPREGDRCALTSKDEEDDDPTANIKHCNRVDGDREHAIDVAKNSSVQEEHRAFDQK